MEEVRKMREVYQAAHTSENVRAKPLFAQIRLSLHISQTPMKMINHFFELLQVVRQRSL